VFCMACVRPVDIHFTSLVVPRPYSEVAANLVPPKGIPKTKIVPSSCGANTSANSYRNYETLQVK